MKMTMQYVPSNNESVERKYWGKTSYNTSFCRPHTLDGMCSKQSQVSTFRYRRLTTWTMEGEVSRWVYTHFYRASDRSAQ